MAKKGEIKANAKPASVAKRAYNARPEQKKRRAGRNAARRKMEAAGKVRKGDGKDVDHRTPLSKGGTNSKSNLRVVDSSSNRSFLRNSDGSLRNQMSKRERKKNK